jgi:glycosyltransferase involved in cell wall biosynthesis
MSSSSNQHFWVIYPFSAETIGAESDDYVIQSNDSNAFYKAMRQIQLQSIWRCTAIFLTGQRKAYTMPRKALEYRFFPVSWPQQKGANMFGKQWSLRLLLSLVRRRPKAVLLFINFGWYTLALALCCRLLKIPYFVVLAGWGVSGRRAQHWFLRHAKTVIVHTEMHKKHLAERGFDVSHFMVVPMGVDTSLFQTKYADGQNPDSDRPYPRLIHSGRIVARKNLLAALQAFVKVREVYPEAVFDVVGPPSDPEYWEKIQQFLQEADLGESVQFLGLVPNENMAALYQAADVMFFPTLSESFGFVIAESMACGTPVVALRGSGSPDELIDHEETGLLVEPEQLEDALLDLLQDREKLTQMGHAARRKVERCYSDTYTYEQLRGMLESADSQGMTR